MAILKVRYSFPIFNTAYSSSASLSRISSTSMVNAHSGCVEDQWAPPGTSNDQSQSLYQAMNVGGAKDGEIVVEDAPDHLSHSQILPK